MRLSEARRRTRQRLFVIFLVVMLIPYGRQIASSPTLGQDFRAFFAAATVVANHGDPYDWPSLARAEYRLYDAPSKLVPGDRAYYEFLAYPEGPWLAFALAPLTGLPWQAAYALYAVVLGLLLLAAAYTTLTILGWNRKRAIIGAACTLLCAVGFINLFMGQVSVIVFAAFAIAWLLAGRGYGRWAGVLLVLIWLKPNIGLPLPFVVALLEPAAARRVLTGFIAASAVAFGVAFAVLGLGFFEWPLQVPRMWQAVQGPQPDLSSIESFFYPGLSGAARTVSLLLTLAAATGYGVWAIRRAADPKTRGLTLLLLWLAALPFVQSYDLVLLLPVVAMLLGAEIEGWAHPLNEVIVWAFAIVPLCYFLGLRFGYFNGFSAVPVLLLLLAWHRYGLVSHRPVLARLAA